MQLRGKAKGWSPFQSPPRGVLRLWRHLCRDLFAGDASWRTDKWSQNPRIPCGTFGAVWLHRVSYFRFRISFFIKFRWGAQGSFEDSVGDFTLPVSSCRKVLVCAECSFCNAEASSGKKCDILGLSCTSFSFTLGRDLTFAAFDAGLLERVRKVLNLYHN